MRPLDEKFQKFLDEKTERYCRGAKDLGVRFHPYSGTYYQFFDCGDKSPYPYDPIVAVPLFTVTSTGRGDYGKETYRQYRPGSELFKNSVEGRPLSFMEALTASV